MINVPEETKAITLDANLGQYLEILHKQLLEIESNKEIRGVLYNHIKNKYDSIHNNKIANILDKDIDSVRNKVIKLKIFKDIEEAKNVLKDFFVIFSDDFCNIYPIDTVEYKHIFYDLFICQIEILSLINSVTKSVIRDVSKVKVGTMRPDLDLDYEKKNKGEIITLNFVLSSVHALIKEKFDKDKTISRFLLGLLKYFVSTLADEDIEILSQKMFDNGLKYLEIDSGLDWLKTSCIIRDIDTNLSTLFSNFHNIFVKKLFLENELSLYFDIAEDKELFLEILSVATKDKETNKLLNNIYLSRLRENCIFYNLILNKREKEIKKKLVVKRIKEWQINPVYTYYVKNLVIPKHIKYDIYREILSLFEQNKIENVIKDFYELSKQNKEIKKDILEIKPIENDKKSESLYSKIYTVSLNLNKYCDKIIKEILNKVNISSKEIKNSSFYVHLENLVKKEAEKYLFFILSKNGFEAVLNHKALKEVLGEDFKFGDELLLTNRIYNSNTYLLFKTTKNT